MVVLSLAITGDHRHIIIIMRRFFSLSIIGLSISASGFAAAQIELPKLEAPVMETPEILKDETDYSQLSEADEKVARLEVLFEKLAQEKEDEEQAGLIAEEITAQWGRSGSASVDLLLRQGTTAQLSGNLDVARRMFNHVTSLAPDYAEGWAGSGRLAYIENDLDRAVAELTQSLILEPRQFYALGTLGTILEKLGRTEQAYTVFQEAYRLYPAEPTIKSRYEALGSAVDGDVL